MFTDANGWSCYTPAERQAILDSTGTYYDEIVAEDTESILASHRRELAHKRDRRKSERDAKPAEESAAMRVIRRIYWEDVA